MQTGSLNMKKRNNEANGWWQERVDCKSKNNSFTAQAVKQKKNAEYVSIKDYKIL